MKTFHVGGMNPVRRYKTLESALAQAKDDDTIELHKNVAFSGKVSHNVILSGNGHTVTIENGNVGLDCTNYIVIKDLNFISEPRSNALILRKGGRLKNVTAKIKGPARVLYPTIIAKEGKLLLNDCDIVRFSGEERAEVIAENVVFRDYYGAVFHLKGQENLSNFYGKTELRNCKLECCHFIGEVKLVGCTIGAFNRSSNNLNIVGCGLEPTVNKPAVNLSKEPEDGPLEKRNEYTKFALEHETGTVSVYGYTSNIPEEFVGFHVLDGSLEIHDTENEDASGYHIIHRGALSFVDVKDAAFYEIRNAKLSMVRSEVNTSMKTKTAMERLQELIGLEEVKKSIKSIVNNIAMNQKNKNKDFYFSYHMVFAGDPGTGKTTVAKIVAQALFEIGAVPENKCTEVSVDRLVKGYVGQTAEHVREVLDDALGGVLFIDEAYELSVKENQNSFNSEVLSVLIRYMEEHRDNLVVIAAGYEKEMKEFLASNVGLTRRFQWVSFPDYTIGEMVAIFESMRKAYEENYEDENLVKLLPLLFENLVMLYKRKPDSKGRITNGGNGGLVRNVFQQVLTERNNRVAGSGLDEEISITQGDLKAGFKNEMEKALKV